ncbi:MAG TPA: hypothetical protein ENJ82_03240 [Bacteroidetes bacterium]|nr:hypothetical protein [Bacteroidota bacterium]
MKRLIVFPALAFLLYFAGCTATPEHPAEAEVKAKLVGTYCSDDYKHRFILGEDGRYLSRRNKKNALASGIIGEKCEGDYSLKYNEESFTWTLELDASDKASNPFVKCKAASLEIWQSEKGYLFGDGPIVLKEPFQQASVSKDKCGDS